ncbi:MAG: hypothetical protein M0Z51_11100 [Propionibacterium sp.]|nr:hypothetical protein [Propionibacterium sp.]
MSEPTHNPAPVDLPDIDLIAPVICQHHSGCGRQAEWRIRSRCDLPHAWVLLCDKHCQEEQAKVPALYRCTLHKVLIRPGSPVEWRPL